MRRPRLSRKALDEWLPTAVRWLGFVTMVYGVYDHFQNPAIIPAATGMLLFKSVVRAGKDEE